MAERKPVMTDEEMRHFIDTVAAMTMANNAMIACLMAGVPCTMEHVVSVVGRAMNPDNPHFEEMALAIDRQRAATVDNAKSLRLDTRRK